MEGSLTVVAVKAGFTCITVLGNFRISGNIAIQGCRNHYHGGAIESTNFTMESGDLKIRDCSAYSGGAISAGHLEVHGGTMEITNCQAQGDGGGIEAKKLLMLGGRLRLEFKYGRRYS